MKPIYIESSERAAIRSQCEQHNITGMHCTNGTFVLPSNIVIPTTLAGFKNIVDTYPTGALAVALNSDKSLKNIGIFSNETQIERARKVAEPLAQCFPYRQILVMFYDENTPAELYQSLKRGNHTRSLHKWAYGTTDNAPMIAGAECFEMVYGYPLPNDQKPVCYDLTAKPKMPQNVAVKDLRGTLITGNNTLLFALPDALQQWHAAGVIDGIGYQGRFGLPEDTQEAELISCLLTKP